MVNIILFKILEEEYNKVDIVKVCLETIQERDSMHAKEKLVVAIEDLLKKSHWIPLLLRKLLIQHLFVEKHFIVTFQTNMIWLITILNCFLMILSDRL